jgi:formamidopyrimidine-DNA glycosylase
MPELPEVESVRRQLEPLVVGRTITEGWGHPSPKFASAPTAAGAAIEAVGRRGKYLLLALDDDRELIVHLGMTGQLRFRRGDLDPHVRAWWALDDSRVLELRDVRRFGRVGVVPAGEHASLPTLAAQGPEPWDPALDDGGLWRNLRRSRVRVKTQLLSQRPLAGVGNIYADEALWRARVHPETPARRVSATKAALLHHAIRDVLAASLEAQGTTLHDYRTVNGEVGAYLEQLAAYGHAEEPCPRCGAPLRRTAVGQRGTVYCARCQRRRA